MKTQIVHTKSNRSSCIGYDDTWLMISSEELHAEFESLSHHTKSFHKSGTNGYAAIPLNSIKEIQYFSKHSEFFIRYISPKSQKLKKYYLSIGDDNIRTKFCSSLANECSLLSRNEIVSPFAKLLANIISILITAVLTYSAYHIASGGEVHHRKATVRLVAGILQIIGPEFVIPAGGLIVLYFVYRIIKNYINPTEKIIYK